MTDAATGSATPAPSPAVAAAAAANAGIPPASNGAAAPGGSGTGAAADPFSGLETGIREAVGKHGIKDMSPESFGKLAKIAVSAESLIGKSVQVPDFATAKPEELDKFYGKLGRPEKADGYEFKLPDGMPEGMPYDGEFAKAFKAEAHKAGLTPKQATAAHDFYVAKAADQFKASQQALVEKAEAATGALEKTWGPKTGDKFKDGSEMALRAIKGLGLEAAVQTTGLLGPGNLVLDPAVALAFEKVGRTMFREGELPTGLPGAGADNPFKDGPATISEPGKPAKGNLTEQMAAIKKDRKAAATMMRAAGRKPSEWGLPDTE